MLNIILAAQSSFFLPTLVLFLLITPMLILIILVVFFTMDYVDAHHQCYVDDVGHYDNVLELMSLIMLVLMMSAFKLVMYPVLGFLAVHNRRRVLKINSCHPIHNLLYGHAVKRKEKGEYIKRVMIR
jgi:hypothetical protein